MKTVAKVSLGIVLGMPVLLMLGYIVFVIYINWPDSPIAKNLRITQEWAEIIANPPLKATHVSQRLKLRIADFKYDPNAKISEINLPDGTVIKPEIEIYDDAGHGFAMHHSGFGSKYYDTVVFRPSNTLPSDKGYTKVRIRSDVPFTCEGIYWSDYNPK